MEQVFTDKTFEKADFRVQALPKTEYENCVFRNCDFSNGDLEVVIFIACVFVDCNLSLAKLSNTAFRDVQFSGCKMLGLHFEHCNEFGLSFSLNHCVVNHSSFYRLKLKKVVFKDSQLQECDLSECDLTSAIISNCDLSGAMFDSTNIEKADLRGSFNYSIDPERNRIKKAKFSLSTVAGLLDKYKIEIDAAH